MMEGGGGRSLLRFIGVWYPGTWTGEIRPASDKLYRPTLSCFGSIGVCFSGDCWCCQESRDLPEPEPEREGAEATAGVVAAVKSSGVGVLSPCLLTVVLASPLAGLMFPSWMAVSFFDRTSSAASTLELLQATRAVTAAFCSEKESDGELYMGTVLK